MTEIPIPELPPELFIERVAGTKQVIQEPQSMYAVDDRVFPNGVEYPAEGGIVVHKVGGDLINDNGVLTMINPVPLLYPEKGFPTPERVLANNRVKAYLMGWVMFFGYWPTLIAFAPFAFLPWKYKCSVIIVWMKGFYKFAGSINKEHYFKDIKHYSLPCQELCTFIGEFLTALGLPWPARGIGFNIAHLIEYDSAYRYWMEDIASTVAKHELYHSPRKGIKTMVDAFADRHPKPHIVMKFVAFGRILSLILLLPRVKRAFRAALEKTNWSRIQLDDADRYHVLRFANYKFMGIPIEERIKTYHALHNGNPPKAIQVSGE